MKTYIDLLLPPIYKFKGRKKLVVNNDKLNDLPYLSIEEPCSFSGRRP